MLRDLIRTVTILGYVLGYVLVYVAFAALVFLLPVLAGLAAIKYLIN